MSTTIKQAIDGFLLSCKVEGKSCGTIKCYSDKLKGFLWYATNYDWPDDLTAITTNHLREFLAYLRETPHRFNSTYPRAMRPINNTTIQKYYRALSALFNWSINEGILETSSLVKIKVPKAEKKVVKALDSSEINQLISSLLVFCLFKPNHVKIFIKLKQYQDYSLTLKKGWLHGKTGKQDSNCYRW
ncbi:tyrosine-type recombinase/integrase [Chloroflexota bacterium]